MGKDSITIIGGGLFPVEIDIEENLETDTPSEYDLNAIERNKSYIEYLKKVKNYNGLNDTNY